MSEKMINMDQEPRDEKTAIVEQILSDKRMYLEHGLNKWLDLVDNRKWTIENMPEQEEVWRADPKLSTLTKLVSHAQTAGVLNIIHYWNGTLGHSCREWFLPQIEKTNEFCKQNNIPFAFSGEYIKRIKLLHDKLLESSEYLFDKERKTVAPKDTTVYDTDPILIPFLPHIKEIEKKGALIPSVEETSPWAYRKIIEQIEGSPGVIREIQTLLDDAEKSGSSYAIGNEAKEAIDLFLENIEQKKRLYELLKEREIKIPVRLTGLNTVAIMECALFEKKYNDRVFNSLLFSEELNHDYARCRNKNFEEIYKRREEIKRTVSQQILGQEFIDLQNEITEK